MKIGFLNYCLVFGISISFLAGCDEKPKPNEFFQMRDSIKCVVSSSKSSDDGLTAKKGDAFTLIDLKTQNPRKVSFAGLTSPFTSVFNTDTTLVLFFQATGTGSTESIFVDKKTGVFSQSFGGNMNGPYAGYNLGSCQ